MTFSVLYRDNRRRALRSNGNFVYSGYGALTRRYLFVPVFSPSIDSLTARAASLRSHRQPAGVVRLHVYALFAG